MNVVTEAEVKNPEVVTSGAPAQPAKTEQTSSGSDEGFFGRLVDKLPANVLVCDPDTFNITYANQTSIDTLKLVQEYLPAGVTADNIVGQCIDVFHKNPAHQRQMLANPSNLPHSAIIRLGPHLLELYIDAMYDDSHKVEHLMLSWTIVTERERLKTMIDNMPINIMLASGGVLKVIDFGQACRIGQRKHRIQGTPDYIAPEQVSKMPLDQRTDVFNLGATKAKSTARYLALDPSVMYKGEWRGVVGTPCNITVIVNEGRGANVGKKYNNIAGISAMRPKDVEGLAALVNPSRVFDLDEPDVDVFKSLPEWIREKITSNLEFAGSKLDSLLASENRNTGGVNPGDGDDLSGEKFPGTIEPEEDLPGVNETGLEEGDAAPF
ncbi:MAG: hypothetical protein IIC56_09440 [Proteobacteria bacterium]|nr:hypothetical protein [Pseudomonadota bacterium]